MSANTRVIITLRGKTCWASPRCRMKSLDLLRVGSGDPLPPGRARAPRRIFFYKEFLHHRVKFYMEGGAESDTFGFNPDKAIVRAEHFFGNIETKTCAVDIGEVGIFSS